MTKQKTKPNHPFIQLVSYVIYANPLGQKEKKKKDVQEMHKVPFSVISRVWQTSRIPWEKTTTAMENLCQGYKNWLRVALLNNFSGRELCHNLLFNMQKLRNDEMLKKEKH